MRYKHSASTDLETENFEVSIKTLTYGFYLREQNYNKLFPGNSKNKS